LLFGTTEDSGCIIFHDGWLVVEVNTNPLQMDVMTPHHPSWVDGSAPPTDFDSPNPVPFLSVAGAFHVAVSWHGPDDDYPKAVAWTELALDLLVVAIGDWGIGGKTSSGYGRMKEVDAANRKRPFSATALGLPAAGSIVEATLLEAPKKTNRGEQKLHCGTGGIWLDRLKGHHRHRPNPARMFN
ncbi:MAG: type III-B CRISPR module RAMP protein Cmr6, partial [Gemmataceae bacterium]|nr:type III-B CRISPR module RAMP protein Cmr6 [Gemmataceae bacterium]